MTKNNLPKISADGEILELPKWKNPFNIHLFPRDPGYRNDLPSETIPDMAMTVSDLMQRFNRGLPVDSDNLEYLENEEPLPLMRDLTDIKEMEDYVDRLNERVKIVKEEREAKLAELREKKKAERLVEIEAYLKEREKNA